MESFNQREFSAALVGAGLPVPGDMVQDNHSLSRRHVLRGLHFQLPPYAQAKLVRVLRGAIYDVIVDIRHASPSFGRWFGLELSADNHQQLWVPEGFAHGFQVISDVAEVLYKTTSYYSPQSDRSIAWNDPSIAILWPEPQRARLSEKDRTAPTLERIRPELIELDV